MRIGIFSVIFTALLFGQAYACPDYKAWGVDQQTFSGDDLYQERVFGVLAGGENNLREDCSHIYQKLQSDTGTGYFTSKPDFTIETPGMTGYDLHIEVVSDCDSSLLINTPAGNWFFDDDDNEDSFLDPKIVLENPSSGLLDIWVGTYNGETCKAQLKLETFVASSQGGCPSYDQVGVQQATFSGDDLYQPRSFSVTAGGPINLQDDCRDIYGNLQTDTGTGYFTSQPDFTINTPGMDGYELHISVVSECDASLLVNTPAANWFFDDDDNSDSYLDPKIVLTDPSSGRLDIWVGTYNGDYCDAELTLETFLPERVNACPSYDQMGVEQATYSGDDLYQRRSFTVVAGGPANLRDDCGDIYSNLQTDSGTGYFASQPDFTINTPGMDGYELHINVVSECDASLLINTPSANWYFDDDDNSDSFLDPAIVLNNPSSGRLDIWVGTYNGEYCDAELTLETFLPAQASACPSYDQTGVQQATFSGNDLYQPRYFKVTAGGPINLQQDCGSIHRNLKTDTGTGYFTSQPDFTINTPGMDGYELHVAVTSDCDASLLINTPAANWYFDDDDNTDSYLDPKIILKNPSSGRLDIWVGTYDGDYCDAELRLETFY